LDAIVPIKKSKGDVVIKQGEDGDNFYVLEEGSLSCVKLMNRSDKEPTFLKNYEPGESFGELALLYNAPRAATITVISDGCLLWSLERLAFTSIIKTSVRKKREKYDDFLGKVEILKCMNNYEKVKMIDSFTEEWFEKDNKIITQGDDGDKFYMIIEGQCKAVKDGQNVKDYTPGDFFGERALLKNEPRAADIIATSEVSCVSLDRDSFKRLLGPLEEILGRNEEEYKKFCS